MQYFRGATAAEIIAVRVDAGEDLLESLGRAAAETQVAAGAIVAGWGTLEHIRLEVPATLAYPSTVYAVEKQGPGQIVSAQGAVVGGAVELYLTVARRNELHAGQVMQGTRALHTAEFTLLRAGNARWTRVPHPQTAVPLLQAAAPPGAPPSVTLMGRPVDPNALALVPPELLRRHVCLPVARTADTLVVAIADPNNPFAIDDLRNATGLRIQTVHVDGRELVPALQQVLAGR
jgi:predicted DNA-binding protein with PD1-like motif